MKKDIDDIKLRTEKTETGCWEWQGKCYNTGYGSIWINGREYTVHRIVADLVWGPITKDQFVLHKCDNPKCCNPDHLFLGTQGDNMRDCVAKGRHRPSYCKGEDAGGAKLTLGDVESIRLRYDCSESTQTELAKEFGVSQGTISQICRRVTWKP